MRNKIKVYFSGSVVNVPHIEQVASLFPRSNFDFFFPHKFTQTNIPHCKYSKAIFDLCIQKMEESDMGLINLDCYGKDSSWECGWYHALNKPLIGYVSASLSFLKDWMIKGGMDGVLVNNAQLFNVIKKDPILRIRKSSIILIDKKNIYVQIQTLLRNK